MLNLKLKNHEKMTDGQCGAYLDEINKAIKALERERDAAKQRFIAKGVGDYVCNEGIIVKTRYVEPTTQIDGARLKAEQPEVAALYTKPKAGYWTVKL